MAKNIVGALSNEISRCDQLIKVYDSIGLAGAFGKAIIERDMKEARTALESGDCIAIIQGSKKLQDAK